MNDSNITIGGSNKIVICIIAYFTITAAKDIICKWLDNQRIEIKPTDKHECKCVHAIECKKPLDNELLQNTETLPEPVKQPAVQNTKNIKIVDNYSKTQNH